MALPSLRERFDGAARALLPPCERADPRSRARARVLLATTAIFLLVVLARLPSLLSVGPARQAATLGIAGAVALAIPAMPRVFGALRPAGHALVAVILVSIVGMVHASGGATSPGLLALMLVPMIAVAVTGRRAGTAWGLLAGGVILAYAVADRAGLSPQIQFLPETWKQIKAVGAFVFTMASLGIMLSYERARRLADAEVEAAAAAAAARVAATEAAHRHSMEWLSSSLAHEANNTLAFVMADLADLGQAESVRPAGELARVGAERLRDLVKDVSALASTPPARPEGAPPVGAVNLSATTHAVLRDIAPLFRRLNIRVEQTCAAEPVFGHGDADAVARCLAGALAATAPDSTVRVRLDRVGGRSMIEVISKTSVLEARPLAIAAAQRTLGALGGRVVTEAVDGGCVLRIDLEAADPPAPAPASAPALDEQPRLRVLVVDDEPALLVTTRRMLARHDVTTTSAPEDALTQILAERFDVVICDLNMPDLRGDEILSYALRRGFDARRFVIVTGGEVPDELVTAPLALRPQVLAKPFTRADLEAVLARASAPLG